MSFFNSQPENDIDKARLALIAFHNQSLAFAPKYSENLNSLTSIVGGKNPTIFMESLGLAINSIGMSIGQTEDAMKSLAVQSQGNIPVQSNFFRALSDRISNPTFIDYVKATPQVAGESALDIVKGAAEVGNAVLDTGKTLLIIGPLLVVTAIVFIGYKRTRLLAGK